jgi:hypothetical protein
MYCIVLLLLLPLLVCSYLRDTETCDTPRCKDVQLHITGTVFLTENAYTLTNPEVGSRRDPNCKYITGDFGSRSNAGEKSKPDISASCAAVLLPL